MKKLKHVRPEDFDVEKLLVAAREGRLYVDENDNTVNKEQIIREVRAYIERIKAFVTNKYSPSVDKLWEQILATDDFSQYLMPGTKARKCRVFNKYNVMRIIGVLREKGVYEQYSDRDFDSLLEPDEKDSPYRRYLGMGIEEHSLLIKIIRIVDAIKL